MAIKQLPRLTKEEATHLRIQLFMLHTTIREFAERVGVTTNHMGELLRCNRGVSRVIQLRITEVLRQLEEERTPQHSLSSNGHAATKGA